MALFDFMPSGLGPEDEEERKRREAEAAAATPTGPVKQTITYDPVSGEQRMKIEGSVEDLSPSNALTPTVSMPGQMPEQAQVAEPVKPPEVELQKQFEVPQAQPVAQAAPVAPGAMPEPAPQPMAQPEAQPEQRGLPPGVQMVNGKLQLAPTQPAIPAEAAQQVPDIGRPPEPGPGVQVAGPAQMPPAQSTVAPVQAAPTPGAAPAAKPSFNEMFTQAGDDPSKFLALRNDTSLTPEQRKLAGREAARLSYMEGDKSDAEQAAMARYQQAAATGNYNDIAKMMKTSSEEGSWGRRILFGMLGMEAAVKDEEAKLGIGAKWQSTMVTDPKTGETKNVLVKYRADGLPSEGYDADSGKKLDAKALAGVPTGTQKLAEVGADTFADPTGKVAGNWVLERKAGQSVYRQVGTNKVATAEEANSLRKIGVQGTLGDQRARMMQEINLKLQGKTEEEKMAILRPYNQQLVANGHAAVDPAEVGIRAPQIGGGQAAPAQAAPAQAAPAQAAPAQAAPAQAAAAGGPVSPAALAQQQATAAAPARPAPAVRPGMAAGVPGVAGVARPAPGGVRPTGSALEAQGAAAKTGAEEWAKNAPQVRREDETAFIDYKNKDLLPKADNGSRLAGIRRDQIAGPDGVLNNPEVAGLLSGTGGQAREFQNIFRDVVGGNFEKVDDMSTRIKAANLTPRMKEVLQIQLQRQREVTPLLIREVAPVGAITDFEQRMAKDAGIDVLRQGLYSSLTNLTRSQFQSDIAAYKSVFADQNPQLRTRQEFDRAWNAEKSRLDASYRKVYEDRARYLGKHNSDGSNNNATIVAFRDHYPVPAFDQGTNTWNFQGYSRKAERPALSTFERR